MNAAGTVYVSNTFGGAIQQITPTGIMTTLTNSFYSSCSEPLGIIVNAAGTIYVADLVAIQEVAQGALLQRLRERASPLAQMLRRGFPAPPISRWTPPE